MKLKEIVSVVGMPGLYKVLSKTKSGFIVESLNDGKRFHVQETAHKVNNLLEISVFMKTEDMLLVEVFLKMKESEDAIPDAKSDPEKMKNYFKKVLPEMDEDRVHGSHLKKIITWYDLLKDKVDFAEKVEEDGSATDQEDLEKPIAKMHETHAPKADQHKKGTTAKLRKKV